jgi:hypothetical protein
MLLLRVAIKVTSVPLMHRGNRFKLTIANAFLAAKDSANERP